MSTASSPSTSLDPNPDDLFARGRDVLADVVGADRQLAMAAIDEDGEPDRPRPPELAQRVHRGAHRAAGVQHVVDEHDGGVVDLERHVRALDERRVAEPRVVAVELDVERADGDVRALVLRDRRGEPPCEGNAAALDADEHEPGRAGLLLDDLVGDADHRPADLIRGHDPAAVHRCSLPASLGHPPAHGPAIEGRRSSVPLARRLSRPGSSPRSCPDHQPQPQISKKSGRYMSTIRPPAFDGP